jgi:hypothetical protein
MVHENSTDALTPDRITTPPEKPSSLYSPSLALASPTGMSTKTTDNHIDNSQKSRKATTTTTTTASGIPDYPYIHNYAYANSQLSSIESYILSHIQETSLVPKASSYGAIAGSIARWCSTAASTGAATDVLSYCDPSASPKLRRDSVPMTTTPAFDWKDTTLITKTASITNTVMLTSSSITASDTNSPTALAQLHPRSNPPQVGTFTTFANAIDGVAQPLLAQFALVSVGILAGMVLGVLMWKYGCPFCCGCVRATGLAAHDWGKPDSERVSKLNE